MTVKLQPQEGPQTQFLACEADIAIYGGAAGGGKSFGLLLDPLRNYTVKEFGGVIFRRTSVQVRIEGSLWDESTTIYPLFRATPREGYLDWTFPSGMTMSFGSLEYDKDLENYQGASIAWIGFDELTHFSEKQFFYMLSRNRSTCGVRPRIRATCNPDPDSWVKHFISWWLDAEGEYARADRAGKVRWFIRINGEIIWADSPEAIYEQYGKSDDIVPKSVAFIPAKLEDNKILMKKNPEYRGNLLAMNRVDQERFLGGNWKVRLEAGALFQRGWFEVVDAIPAGHKGVVRYWDRAATKPNETNKDPDWTRGLLMYQYKDGTFLVAGLASLQDTPGKVDELVLATATQDGEDVEIWGEQDPGSAGKSDADAFVKRLQGYKVKIARPSSDKVVRAKPVSSQAQAKNIKVLRGVWNKDFFDELEAFPSSKAHDDIVDTFSGAFNVLCENPSKLSKWERLAS